MISYTEKGSGLHQAIAAAGHRLENVNGAWVASNDAAVQAIIDAYPLASSIDEMVANIETKASELRKAAVLKYSPTVTPEEMASWPVKNAEAIAYSKSLNPLDAPRLAAEAAARGVTLDVLAAKVKTNADQLAGVEAQIAGTAGRHKDAVRLLPTFQAVLSYDHSTGWPVI